MKYIIQESRINSLMAKYLDSINWLLWDIGDGEFDLSDGYMTNTKINYRHKFNPVFNDEYEVIYIDYDFVTKLSNLFSIERDLIISVIVEWFNKKYNKNLSLLDWEYQDEEEEEYDDFDD